MDVLKDFYWQSYQIVQKGAPSWITLLHDSFRLSVGVFVLCCFIVSACVRLCACMSVFRFYFTQLHGVYMFHLAVALTFQIAQH
jgi:hypothetical protein